MLYVTIYRCLQVSNVMRMKASVHSVNDLASSTVSLSGAAEQGGQRGRPLPKVVAGVSLSP